MLTPGGPGHPPHEGCLQAPLRALLSLLCEPALGSCIQDQTASVHPTQTPAAPDKSGTAGNLHVDPRAAIVAIDYSTGDVLQLTGTCSILWDQHDLPGAERTLQFTTQAWNWAPGGIPLAPSGDAVKPSPYNPAIESWQHHHDAAKVGSVNSHVCSSRPCEQWAIANCTLPIRLGCLCE